MTRPFLDLGTLIERGWLEVPNYFPENQTRSLMDWLLTLSERDRFRPATIRSTKELVREVRSDSIYWVEDWETNPAIASFRDDISELGSLLSRELLVSLKSFEGHLSHYGPGSFYRKHIDQHLGQKRRQVTLVSYLNDCEGGELAIYNRDNRKELEAVVTPRAGKLVLFLSAFIFHEVKTCDSDRYGLTGWFRDDWDEFGTGLIL